MLARLPQRESSLCECDITGAITFRTATPRCPPGSTNQPRVTGRLDIVLRLSAFGRTLRLLPSAGPLRRIYRLRTKNPDLDYLLRGTVHDTTARRMGGVAGHAGVFSTAHDVSTYAQALHDRLAGRPSEFPLQQTTLELMTTPQQPGHTAQQLEAANEAAREAVATRPNTTDPLLAPHYPAITGQNLRGFGWDIDTRLSTPRGLVFPIGTFGHTGFTGTTLWIDPGSDTYVVLLSNSIHVRGSSPIQELRGDLATATARALRLYGSG
jgi:CubicO group peptidase (beta-lactamase class C family)